VTGRVGWLEFNVPFQHKYGYIRDEGDRKDRKDIRPVITCAVPLIPRGVLLEHVKEENHVS